jgi:hypothetical protein
MATTRYGRLTTIQPIVEEDTSLALIRGFINKDISLKPLDLKVWYPNLYYGIEIFCPYFIVFGGRVVFQIKILAVSVPISTKLTNVHILLFGLGDMLYPSHKLGRS